MLKRMFIEDGLFPCPFCAAYAPILDIYDSALPNGESIVFEYVNAKVSTMDIAAEAYSLLSGTSRGIIATPTFVEANVAIFFPQPTPLAKFVVQYQFT